MAFSFLWRLPIRVYPRNEDELKGALPFFPLAGALEGLLLALMAQFLSSLILPEYLAMITLIFHLYIRGIFHLDGLSDTFDALAYKGIGKPEDDQKKRLSIMKDSTVGVAGVTAITLTMMGKIFFIKDMIIYNPLYLFYPFFFSRAFLLWIIYFSKPAKEEGLGYLMKKSLTKGGLIGGNLISLIILLIINLFIKIPHLRSLLSLSLFIFLFYFFLNRKFNHFFGGLTGDNYGALIELIEIITLFYLVSIWPKL